MRAATWSSTRNITAARVSWQRARQVADQLPVDDPDRTSMRIAPRTRLCGTAWRVNISIAGVGFDELRDLAAAAGDKVSLAIGMAGLLQTQALHDRPRESSPLASEYTGLLESIDDPTLTLGLSSAAMTAKYFAGEMTETLRLAQHAIDLADGDPTKGNLIVASPLAWAFDSRGGARWALGLAGWRSDFDQAIAVAAAVDPMLQAITDRRLLHPCRHERVAAARRHRLARHRRSAGHRRAVRRRFGAVRGARGSRHRPSSSRRTRT